MSELSRFRIIFLIINTIITSPVYIETQYAWYILRSPNHRYAPLWKDFYHFPRLSQLIISSALENPNWDYAQFCAKTLDAYDELLGFIPTKKHIRDLVNSDLFSLQMAVECVVSEKPELNTLYNCPLISMLLDTSTQPGTSATQNSHHLISNPRSGAVRFGINNIDLAVLRPENQEKTHVTSFINQLASNPVFFREHLQVIGPEPKPISPQEIIQQDKKLFDRLSKLCQIVQNLGRRHLKIHFARDDAVKSGSNFWKCVQLDGVLYKVGDSICVQAGEADGQPAPVWPVDLLPLDKSHSISDLCWFARIVNINSYQKTAHIQYYQHSSKSILQEISDPQELFLTETCWQIDLEQILSKVDVHFGYYKIQSSTKLDDLHFFCNMLYNIQDGSFTTIPDQEYLFSQDPPHNCPVCLISDQKESESFPCQIVNGLAFMGENYHIHDFVLIQSESCPHEEPPNSCDNCKRVQPGIIGQITGIKWAKTSRHSHKNNITIRMLGRISEVVDVDGCPKDIIRDEQHLFFTDLEQDVPITSIVRKLYVLHKSSLSEQNLATFLQLSPWHLYVQYSFPHWKVQRWREGKKLSEEDVQICPDCFKENQVWQKNTQRFLAAQRKKGLRTLDLFGGCGAFSLAMKDLAWVRTTHAIEISPSAAQTLKNNSPETIVYNQCANRVLKYAYKSYLKQLVKTPKSLGDNKVLPPPPKPEDIDCIIAGFPCQPHSTLNMYQNAHDKKSHLILNLLSWVDFLKPKYCFFENVRGFMKYKLNAQQKDRYKIIGGIELGGLKFVIRAMLAMGYQVRFGLLQAAHYGTPQSRVSFPVPDAMEIKPPEQAPLRLFSSSQLQHTGLQMYVTIKDAIEDLPYFDWRHPEEEGPWRIIQHPDHGLELTIEAHQCNPSLPKCGISGKNFQYVFRKPQTSFQARCRNGEVQDIQHFTRVLKNEVVKRVIHIPLKAKADYRNLPQSLWEWQIANPNSATARHGFGPGFYGRLDQDGWFHTTVTNVEPTAKQSWVLHPWCKRVVTVRELARSQGFPDSFVFHSINGDVKTMHRQIGNAVPWPVSQALARELRDAMSSDWYKAINEAEEL
ncbi:hypothetical protein QCA50_010145 [Cerrena zonata]|uniref:DNA (cytosine-5-)-methyltransferase n=1 Tax=Cerrena zonata TaxID=2478898 RepID=A0AAW0GBU7_9APHY